MNTPMIRKVLTLFRDDVALMSTRVSLGAVPDGHKVQEGDEKPPTGTYKVDWRNANSIAHLSLHISYPNAADTANAAAAAKPTKASGKTSASAEIKLIKTCTSAW